MVYYVAILGEQDVGWVGDPARAQHESSLLSDAPIGECVRVCVYLSIRGLNLPTSDEFAKKNYH